MSEVDEVTLPVLVAVTALRGGVFWRQNSGTFRTMDGRRVVKVCAEGAGDIMGAYRGHPVAIETKVSKGRLEKTQIRFRRAWQGAGGIYIIARSPDDALSALAALS